MYRQLKKEAPKQQTIQKKDAKKPNNTGISNTLKAKYENHSGLSFDDVRVHYNSDKPAQFQALAYTQGNQVYIAPRQERYLEHELGHVVQQKQGIVKPTGKINNIAVNEDKNLEKRADYLGQSVANMGVESGNQNSTIQCKEMIQFTREAIKDLAEGEMNLEVLKQHLELCKEQFKQLEKGEIINTGLLYSEIKECNEKLNQIDVSKLGNEESIKEIKQKLTDFTDTLNISFQILSEKKMYEQKEEKDAWEKKDAVHKHKQERLMKLEEKEKKKEDEKASLRTDKYGKKIKIEPIKVEKAKKDIWQVKIVFKTGVLEEIEKAKINEWVKFIEGGDHPKTAAEKIGSSHYEQLKGTKNSWSIRLSQGTRVHFSLDEIKKIVCITQLDGHDKK